MSKRTGPRTIPKHHCHVSLLQVGQFLLSHSPRHAFWSLGFRTKTGVSTFVIPRHRSSGSDRTFCLTGVWINPLVSNVSLSLRRSIVGSVDSMPSFDFLERSPSDNGFSDSRVYTAVK